MQAVELVQLDRCQKQNRSHRRHKGFGVTKGLSDGHVQTELGKRRQNEEEISQTGFHHERRGGELVGTWSSEDGCAHRRSCRRHPPAHTWRLVRAGSSDFCLRSSSLLSLAIEVDA